MFKLLDGWILKWFLRDSIRQPQWRNNRFIEDLLQNKVLLRTHNNEGPKTQKLRKSLSYWPWTKWSVPIGQKGNREPSWKIYLQHPDILAQFKLKIDFKRFQSTYDEENWFQFRRTYILRVKEGLSHFDSIK